MLHRSWQSKLSYNKSRNKKTLIATSLNKTFGIRPTQPTLFEVVISKKNATSNVSKRLVFLTKRASLGKKLRVSAATMWLGRTVLTHAISCLVLRLSQLTMKISPLLTHSSLVTRRKKNRVSQNGTKTLDQKLIQWKPF